jgi:glycine/D-amino acid oxidase-like deaminating enzyme
MHDALFAEGAKLTPYWWDGVQRPTLPDATLPSAVDVLVVGSGYTGLSAALQTVRGGRSTIVLDAEDAGWGCSTRNGGQISTSVKAGYDDLAGRYGAETALRIVRDGRNSLAWVADFVATERIDCDFRVVGRFHAAHSAGQYEKLARKLAAQPAGLEVAAHMVPRAEQRTELGTDAYFGGVVYEHHAAINPARFHQGMLDRVLQAGAAVIPHCAVTGIQRESGGLLVRTARGAVRARNVIVATNGYTGNLVPWLQRRVIRIGSYMIATEPVAKDTMMRLMPKGRVVSDTRKVVYYYRPSPDGTRILFGGRVSSAETNPLVSGPRLHGAMAAIFPELSPTRISHSWFGFVAYTFDQLMHAGEHDGVHYAMGYCGSGAGMAGYLGMRVGQQVLGLPQGRTGFDDIAFPTRPYYRGTPWFVGPAVAYYQWHDRMAR